MARASLNRWRCGGVAAFLVSAFLLALLTAENPLPARDEGRPAALPSDLARIPSDATLVVSGRIADLWGSELAKPARQKFAKDLDKGAREFEKEFGLPLGQVERLTLVLLTPPPGREQPLLFVRTTKPYDRAKVVAGKKAKEQKYKDQTLFVGEKDWAVYPLDGQSLVYGAVETIHGLIDHPAPKTEGRLSAALRLAAGQHSLTIGVNVKSINDAVGNMLPGELEPFKPLLQALSATVVVDLAAQSRVAVDLTFATEADAKASLKPIKAGLDLAHSGLDRGITQLAREKETAKFVEFLKQLQGALKAAKVEQDGKALRASTGLKMDVATAGVIVLEGVQKVREAAARTQSANNLKQIGLAFHNYHDSTGSFPAHASYNKNGKPMLSWRVLILSYIEEDALYKEFHLDEPWDSDHNKKLLAKMPKLYASPHDANTLKDHTTYYQGFVGKGAVFEGKKGIRITDITDGTSNTIMIAEAAKPVPWTKPEDIPYDAAKPVPKLGLSPRGFQAVFCDGSVHTIANTIKLMTLRNLITRNDGNPIDSNDF